LNSIEFTAKDSTNAANDGKRPSWKKVSLGQQFLASVSDQPDPGPVRDLGAITSSKHAST